MGAFAYSPALRESAPFTSVVQLGVFPLVALAGLAMWPGPRWAPRWARRRHRRATA